MLLTTLGGNMKNIFLTILVLFICGLYFQSISQTQSELTYEKAIQSVLKAYGYYSGNIDGSIGPLTTSALRSFQYDMGLSVTGSADAATAQAMIKLLETPSSTFKHNSSNKTSTSIDKPFTSWSLPSPPVIIGNNGEYLGSFSANEYDPNSVSNPYGILGSQYSPKSINNPYGQYGSSYSPDGIANPFTTGGPKLFGSDGNYLGRLNSNPYDPESISNPYGIYGSPYSPTSINNPYSIYGNPYSPYSATNPYSTTTKSLFDWDK